MTVGYTGCDSGLKYICSDIDSSAYNAYYASSSTTVTPIAYSTPSNAASCPVANYFTTQSSVLYNNECISGPTGSGNSGNSSTQYTKTATATQVKLTKAIYTSGTDCCATAIANGTPCTYDFIDSVSELDIPIGTSAAEAAVYICASKTVGVVTRFDSLSTGQEVSVASVCLSVFLSSY